MAHDRRFRFGLQLVRAGLGRAGARAALAACSTTLRVGPLVLGEDFRAPRGRGEGGGDHRPALRRSAGTRHRRGWMTVDDERAGIALDPQPTLVPRPHPPLVTRCGGPKVLALPTRHADIVGINATLRSGSAHDSGTAASLDPAATDEEVAWVHDAAGACAADLEIQALAGFVQVTDDAAAIAEAMAGHVATTPADVPDSPVALVGTVDGIVEALQRRRARWDLTDHVVPLEQMDAFTPVVARLAGT